MILRCFRYETFDGSGPCYNLDGTNKFGGRDFPADEFRSACDSRENLIKWFNNDQVHLKLDGYRIVEYIVDLKDEKRYNRKNGHITFSIKEIL